jgi:glycosyltransferase involved in cell wall biosynthesis
MRSWRSVLARPERISVAMATYDGERFLPEMLASLADQTRRPDELVVRDDGSSDRTTEILGDFAGSAPFPVHQVPSTGRLGYAQNFVAAGRACSGDLLFFADQDDVWRPEKLELVAGAVRGSEPVVVSHDFSLMAEDRSEIAPSFFGVLAERGFGPAVALKGCSLAMNRAFVDTWGWPPLKSGISHDFWVVLLATAFDQRVILPEVLIDHRLHDGNTSGWIPDDSAREFTRPRDRASDVELLIDLIVKKPRLRGPTLTFLDVANERGEQVDPAAARRLRRSLRTNRRLHREAAELRSQPQET